MREGPSGFEIRALHIAVMKRDVEMTRLLLEAGADTRDGIWPNRDATGPLTIAEERGYDEIVAMMIAQEEKRGARGVNALDDGFRRLRDAMMTGGEEAVIAVFESEPATGRHLPTRRHDDAAPRGRPRPAPGGEVAARPRGGREQPSQPIARKGRTPLEFAVWECAAEPWGGSAMRGDGRAAHRTWCRS